MGGSICIYLWKILPFPIFPVSTHLHGWSFLQCLLLSLLFSQIPALIPFICPILWPLIFCSKFFSHPSLNRKSSQPLSPLRKISHNDLIELFWNLILCMESKMSFSHFSLHKVSDSISCKDFGIDFDLDFVFFHSLGQSFLWKNESLPSKFHLDYFTGLSIFQAAAFTSIACSFPSYVQTWSRNCSKWQLTWKSQRRSDGLQF